MPMPTNVKSAGPALPARRYDTRQQSRGNDRMWFRKGDGLIGFTGLIGPTMGGGFASCSVIPVARSGAGGRAASGPASTAARLSSALAKEADERATRRLGHQWSSEQRT
jgi:hypothetical protein